MLNTNDTHKWLEFKPIYYVSFDLLQIFTSEEIVVSDIQLILGTINMHFSNSLKVLEFYEPCLKIRLEKASNSEKLADIQNKLGTFYLQQAYDEKHYDKSIELFNEVVYSHVREFIRANFSVLMSATSATNKTKTKISDAFNNLAVAYIKKSKSKNNKTLARQSLISMGVSGIFRLDRQHERRPNEYKRNNNAKQHVDAIL